ncbi:type II toxin-antitoxin system Phd/YefM family antitoxin [Macrococcoides goetzii]|nr:type II toxin-antitoxin system prevent-host-death family antitoxin [Macrococcus goetzii]TDM40576.1 type II toxin-antitoxin system Phd/YefM family antitoxin [Macrococcus goetzii]TDM45385.1 type II toxin-antitoxin system Phd/YefM family antitoxin [Macrococcus goetzii]
MPKIIPIKDLRNTNEISDMAHETNEPIFVTKNGYGDLVVMSVETYDKLLRDKMIDEKVEQSINGLKNGEKLYDAREMIAELKEKYGEEI